MLQFKSVMSEVSISYKSGNVNRVKVKSSKEAYQHILNFYNHDTLEYEEQCILLFLNRANNTIGWYRVGVGGTSSCVVDVKKVFATALKVNAHAIIISHNHPSGTLTPSDNDDRLTNKLKHAGQLLEIELLDHLIITADGYFSYADQGRL